MHTTLTWSPQVVSADWVAAALTDNHWHTADCDTTNLYWLKNRLRGNCTGASHIDNDIK